MKIYNLHGASTRPGSNLFEGELLRVRQFEEREVFRRRADEDEVVVLGVVQGKQAAALDANLLMKFSKNTIKSVHRQHFADSGIVIEDRRAGIPGAIVIAHANVRASNKGGVTENDPWLLRPGKKTFPEDVKRNRQIGGIARQPGFSNSAVQEAVRGDGNGGGKNYRKRDDGKNPNTGGPAIDLQIVWCLIRGVRVIPRDAMRTRMESKGVGAFGQFHHDLVVRAIRGIVFGQLGT